ncbi:C2 domain [Cinara cedri]|uniref:C2 domain n=1 Tax=Cinara cedri TaxID=506608 RepID=A0A5E4MZU5_9HEMI|nr:C2 domain [Cinara cedri]
MNRSEKIGKIFMAAEILKISNYSNEETENDSYAPLLKDVQPKCRELPEDLNLIPPICFQLFTKNKLQKEPIAVGMCSTFQTINEFLVPMISEFEWKQLRNENPVHSVLEIEEEREIGIGTKIENTNSKLLNSNKIDSKVYDSELENVPEFEKFEDNIKKFEISGLNNDDNRHSESIAVLKGNIYLYPEPVNKENVHLRESHCSNVEFKIWPKLKSNVKCNIIVRVYILRAHNLHPSDIGGLSDPYVEILFGKSRRISDYKNYIPKSLNPIFGRCYEREVSLPECSVIQIRIMDYDRIGKNELIGETTIDIESRYYSKHRAHCGLPNRFNKDGYNRWRDTENPTNILHKLCLMHSLKPPIYMQNSVKIGSKQFYDPGENKNIDRQSLALYALNHWHEMPVVGYFLVPEHVETRTLYNPNMPNLHQVIYHKIKK